jgi:hypothetical protein
MFFSFFFSGFLFNSEKCRKIPGMMVVLGGREAGLVMGKKLHEGLHEGLLLKSPRCQA